MTALTSITTHGLAQLMEHGTPDLGAEFTSHIGRRDYLKSLKDPAPHIVINFFFL